MNEGALMNCVVPLSASTFRPRSPDQSSSRTMLAPVSNDILEKKCPAACIRECGVKITSVDVIPNGSTIPDVHEYQVFFVCSAPFGSPEVPDVNRTMKTRSGSSRASSSA